MHADGVGQGVQICWTGQKVQCLGTLDAWTYACTGNKTHPLPPLLVMTVTEIGSLLRSAPACPPTQGATTRHAGPHLCLLLLQPLIVTLDLVSGLGHVVQAVEQVGVHQRIYLQQQTQDTNP
jgi:hypothetical protein